MKLRSIILLFLLCPFLLIAQSRPKVALVLGGGGAKGAAHVGVLKYIEEAGVPVDIVVGTSIGSIVGGLYSVGYNSQELDTLFSSQRWPLLLTDRSEEAASKLFSIDDNDLYILGFHFNINPNKPKKERDPMDFGAFKGDSITALFHDLIAKRLGKARTDSCNFDNLPRQYRAMAFDALTFSEVTLDRGSLPLAMRASMSIPLCFRPVKLKDRLLIDGGVMNNLPVDIARSLGADYVIAVDLAVNQQEDRQTYLEDILGINGDSIFEAKGKFTPLSIINWGLFRPDIAQYERNCQNADIYINPDLTGYGPQDFNAKLISEMIQLGDEAGEKALPQLETLAEKVKKGIFPKSSE